MIPLDINKVSVPIEVERSKLATTIIDVCREVNMEIPQEMKAYVLKHDKDSAGYDWERRLMKSAHTMSTPLLTQWLNTVKGHMCRAELRAELKRRKA